jgi:hypothetical protein
VSVLCLDRLFDCANMQLLWQQLVSSELDISEARSRGSPSQMATMS